MSLDAWYRPFGAISTVTTRVVSTLAFGGMFLIAPAAQALVIDGTIFRTGGQAEGTDAPFFTGFEEPVETTVDRFYFDVTTAGVVDFDVLSWEGGTDLNISSSPTDVNGDGEIAFIDAMIRLYDASTDALIGANDDSAATMGDGSIWDRDSFLSVNLAAGSYYLAIATWNLTDAEVLAGSAFGSGPMTWNGSKYVVSDHGDYRLTATGNITPIPEPSSMLLLGLGIAGLAMRGRREAFVDQRDGCRR